MSQEDEEGLVDREEIPETDYPDGDEMVIEDEQLYNTSGLKPTGKHSTGIVKL